jgi:formylglycine-generating enzyme required for sulfatase activity
VKDISDADLKRFPVEGVTWDDCQRFLARLNGKPKESGWVYRVPTQVEWEYACRGGPSPNKEDYSFDYYFDRPSNTLTSDRANFNHFLKRTCKVGSYAPNRLGLYDMHGNVHEWCDDKTRDPQGGWQHYSRSGSWQSPQNTFCRAASPGTPSPHRTRSTTLACAWPEFP